MSPVIQSHIQPFAQCNFMLLTDAYKCCAELKKQNMKEVICDYVNLYMCAHMYRSQGGKEVACNLIDWLSLA